MSPSRENRLDKLRLDPDAVTPVKKRRPPKTAKPDLPNWVKEEIAFDAAVAPVLPTPPVEPPPPLDVKRQAEQSEGALAKPAKRAKRAKPAPVVRVITSLDPVKSDMPAPVVRVLGKRSPAKPAPVVRVLEIKPSTAKPVAAPVVPAKIVPAKPTPVNLVRSAYAKRASPPLGVQELLARRIAFDEAAAQLRVDPLRDKAIEWADRPELANFPVAVTTNAGAMVHEAPTRVAARGMFQYSRLRKAQVAAIYRKPSRTSPPNSKGVKL